MMNLKKYIIKFWKKVKNCIRKEFDSEPVYNEKYLKGYKIQYQKNQHKFSQ